MEKIEIALRYAERGWRVIPLHNPVPGRGCSCKQRDKCSSIGKHPRITDWTTKATTDATTIRDWFLKWPEANIGIATGLASGNFVLDVDDKDSGIGSATLASLEEKHGELPRTPLVGTGFGRHYHFATPGFALNNRVGKAGVGPGLGIRADGGLVVAPGSIHSTGAEYVWLSDEHLPLAPAPQWLIDRIQHGDSTLQSDAPAESAPTAGALTLIPEGQRNHSLFLAASSMRGRGMGQSEIEEQLAEMNAIQCATPLPLQEVQGIVKSATRYVPGKRPMATVGVLKKQDRLGWMKLFPGDILGDRWLSMLPPYQFGWRMRLVLESWRSGGVLPNDVRVLARLAGEPSVELFQAEMGSVLYDFSEAEMDGVPVLFNPELAELYTEQMALYRQKVEASAKAVEAKKAKKQREQSEPEDGTQTA